MDSFIEQLVRENIGVGKSYFREIAKLIIVKDVKESDHHVLLNHFVNSPNPVARCHGIDNRKVETSRIRKSVGVERTFQTDIRSNNALKRLTCCILSWLEG